MTPTEIDRIKLLAQAYVRLFAPLKEMLETGSTSTANLTTIAVHATIVGEHIDKLLALAERN